ncbi:MAG: hypothetical protein LBS79_03385, partial [Tannerella sp.]|nr:hypothetical protein [Tannerella sp.]
SVRAESPKEGSAELSAGAESTKEVSVEFSARTESIRYAKITCKNSPDCFRLCLRNDAAHAFVIANPQGEAIRDTVIVCLFRITKNQLRQP